MSIGINRNDLDLFRCINSSRSLTYVYIYIYRYIMFSGEIQLQWFLLHWGSRRSTSFLQADSSPLLFLCLKHSPVLQTKFPPTPLFFVKIFPRFKPIIFFRWESISKSSPNNDMECSDRLLSRLNSTLKTHLF